MIAKISPQFNALAELMRGGNRMFNPKDKAIIRRTTFDLAKKMELMPGAIVTKDVPTTDIFFEGQYIRDLPAPANHLFVTLIHKKPSVFFLLTGDVSILSEKGITRMKAPCYGFSEAGSQRVVFTHSETRWVNVYISKETDIKVVEKKIFSKNFKDVGKKGR